MKYANLWMRCFAFCIDVMIVAVVWILLLALGRPLAANIPEEGILHLLAFLDSMVVMLSIPILYGALLESSRLQGSLGKLALHIRVAGENGERLSLERAVLRNLVKITLLLPPLTVTFFAIGADRRRRGIHDRVAHSAVLKGRP